MPLTIVNVPIAQAAPRTFGIVVEGDVPQPIPVQSEPEA